jgi:hypothetical protein
MSSNIGRIVTADLTDGETVASVGESSVANGQKVRWTAVLVRRHGQNARPTSHWWRTQDNLDELQHVTARG